MGGWSFSLSQSFISSTPPTHPPTHPPTLPTANLTTPRTSPWPSSYATSCGSKAAAAPVGRSSTHPPTFPLPRAVTQANRSISPPLRPPYPTHTAPHSNRLLHSNRLDLLYFSTTHPPTHPLGITTIYSHEKPRGELLPLATEQEAAHPPTHPPTYPTPSSQQLIRTASISSTQPTHPPTHPLGITTIYSHEKPRGELLPLATEQEAAHPPTHPPTYPTPSSQQLIRTASISSTQPTHPPTHPLGITTIYSHEKPRGELLPLATEQEAAHPPTHPPTYPTPSSQQLIRTASISSTQPTHPPTHPLGITTIYSHEKPRGELLPLATEQEAAHPPTHPPTYPTPSSQQLIRTASISSTQPTHPPTHPLGITTIYSHEKPRGELLPLTTEQETAPSEYGVLENMRLRVLPVLGKPTHPPTHSTCVL